MKQRKIRESTLNYLRKLFDDVGCAAIWSSEKKRHFIIIDADSCLCFEDVLWLAAHEWYHHMRGGGPEGPANAYASRMLHRSKTTKPSTRGVDKK